MSEITVGIDIGTTSVKAIAADADGSVVARARIPHPIHVPSPNQFEHDADEAWRRGPRAALDALGVADVKAVSVAAMVPSLAAVDDQGLSLTPGLLYGDERGHTENLGNPAASGEFVAFLKWTAAQAPRARGYWPAQAVANHALSGEAVLDTATAVTAFPLFDWTGWDETIATSVGARVDQMPRLVPTAQPCGRVDGDGPVLASGCIDALAEQIVAGADDDGDVLVLLGTTLITWVVVPEAVTLDVAGYYMVPHTTQGKMLFGGPSNAGGLFLNWATRLLGDDAEQVDPHRVPVWEPYIRGERAPINDPTRRAALHDLTLRDGPGSIRRAAYEAAGFVVRRAIEASGRDARRIVATGGGTRVDEWVQALADCTNLPVDCVAVPEGGALGSAYLARIAAGLEGMFMSDARRWARTGRRVEPDPRWVDPVANRYTAFLEVAT